MRTVHDMKVWVDLGPGDAARLAALWPLAQPELPALVDRFYRKILQSPAAASVLRDNAQVERLKLSLADWLEELLLGPWDETWVERTRRIGRVHVAVHLPSRFMFTAMGLMQSGLCDIAKRGPDFADTCRAILKVTNLDLAIMTGAYLESHEAEQISSFQDLIVSHMPVTVLLLDGDGLVSAATRSSKRLFGDVPVVGRPWPEALPAPLVEAAQLHDRMAHALATRREIALTRVDVVIDGVERSFRLSLVPLDHAAARLLLHVDELTEAVRIEQRLARAESLAQLGALSTAVAHELRNPLAGISGAVNVIARTLDEADPRKAVMGQVEEQVLRLDSLVSDLLDFARPTIARPEQLSLHAAAVTVTGPIAAEHPGINLRVVGAGHAWADPTLLRQILHNLVLNAVQATEGQGEVLVRVRDGEVLVCDSGPGIPPGQSEQVFMPFFTTRTRGTGLGLAICRKAATAMGGRVGLSLGPLPGAALLLLLPESALPESA